MYSVMEVKWDYIGDSVPAFLTILIIPLTYKYVSLRLCVMVSNTTPLEASHTVSSQEYSPTSSSTPSL